MLDIRVVVCSRSSKRVRMSKIERASVLRLDAQIFKKPTRGGSKYPSRHGISKFGNPRTRLGLKPSSCTGPEKRVGAPPRRRGRQRDTDACDYVCSDAGARTRAALVDDAEAWFTSSSDSSNNNVWRVFMDAPELVAPVAARAAASHEARRSLGLLAGRLRARHGWRAPASILEAASRALGEAMDDDE